MVRCNWLLAGRRTLAKNRTRRGVAAVEEVLILAVVFPVVVGLMFLAHRLFSVFSEIIITLVTWPFL